MKNETQTSLLNRLSRIEGQIRGVAAMVAEDRYCIDIVTQIQAARSALDKVEALILDTHVQTCVAEALASDDLAERQAKVDELVRILPKTRAVRA